MKFVHVTDPFEDEQTAPTSADYQQVAAHSLEALSTAAAGNSTAEPRELEYAEYSGSYEPAGKRSENTLARADQANPDINFLLNPSSTPSALIDPNLEASSDAQGRVDVFEVGKHENSGEDEQQKRENTEQLKEDATSIDQQVYAALHPPHEQRIEGTI